MRFKATVPCVGGSNQHKAELVRLDVVVALSYLAAAAFANAEAAARSCVEVRLLDVRCFCTLQPVSNQQEYMHSKRLQMSSWRTTAAATLTQPSSSEVWKCSLPVISHDMKKRQRQRSSRSQTSSSYKTQSDEHPTPGITPGIVHFNQDREW